ncbi:hypothetical protein DWUX_210 [Desulfovibrio diazotrophicus]|nr:hypothetical protein DWUX_210 [Desulfovibrio diazotrophicus]
MCVYHRRLPRRQRPSARMPAGKNFRARARPIPGSAQKAKIMPQAI